MEKSPLQKLVFVWNADSGLRNLIIDGAHKILSPSTYACSLCSLTYGAFTEKSLWKDFRISAVLPMEFLHKDEFASLYASKFKTPYTLPIILAVTNKGFEVIVSTEELDALTSQEALIELLEDRM